MGNVKPSDVLFAAGGDVLAKYGTLVRRTWPADRSGESLKETFSRSGSAWAIGKNGLYVPHGANVPRVEWATDPTDSSGALHPYLLLEAQRTTLIENSDCEADIVGWNVANLATLLRDNAQAFNGAWSCKVTAGNSTSSGPQWGPRAGGRFAAVAATVYTVSCWVYAPAASVGNTLAFNIQWWNNTPALISSVNGPSTPLVAGWQRLTWTAAASPAGTVTAVPGLLFDANQNGSIIWMDVPQFEASPFASSAIPTGAGAVTRNIETAQPPWYIQPSLGLWIYQRFIERGAAFSGYQGAFSVGSGAGPKFYFVSENNNGHPGVYGVELWCSALAASIISPGVNAFPAVSIGQMVEHLAFITGPAANPTITMRQSINGGAESVASGTGNSLGLPLPAAWAVAVLSLGGGSGAGGQAVSRQLIGLGGGVSVNTIADARAIAF